MQIMIIYPHRFSADGIVLFVGDRWMRVAMRGWDDVAEFRCQDGQWFAENGDPVYLNGNVGLGDPITAPHPASEFLTQLPALAN